MNFDEEISKALTWRVQSTEEALRFLVQLHGIDIHDPASVERIQVVTQTHHFPFTDEIWVDNVPCWRMKWEKDGLSFHGKAIFLEKK